MISALGLGIRLNGKTNQGEAFKSDRIFSARMLRKSNIYKKKKPKFITKEKERNAMKLENVRSDTHI